MLYELKVKEKQSRSTITRKMHEKEEVRKVEKVEQVRSNAKLFAVTYYDLSLAFLSKELQGKNGFPHEYRMWKKV